MHLGRNVERPTSTVEEVLRRMRDRARAAENATAASNYDAALASYQRMKEMTHESARTTTRHPTDRMQ